MTMNLNTHQKYYDVKFPSYKKPNIIKFFSIDENGKCYTSTEKLGYLHWKRLSSKKVHLDLTSGAKDAIRRSEKNEFSLFTYLSDNPELVQNFSASDLQGVGFICNRQILRKISNMPYENKDISMFSAYLFEGNIYICYMKPEEFTNERMEFCSRWGYKFEQYMLSERPSIDPVTDVPVKEGEEFNCVFETLLNDHRILFAAEMDGIIIEKEDNQLPVPDIREFAESAVVADLRKRKFVELKTCGYFENHNSFRKFKSRDIWLQTFLVGVGNIVIGHRSYDGIVEEIRCYTSSDMCEIGRGNWKGNVCMNFCDSFLTYVKKCFSREVSKSQYSDIRNLPPIELFFVRKPREDVQVFKTPQCDNERSYLFPWFISSITKDYKNSDENKSNAS